MDSDLAFCLEKFADEQTAERMEKIAQLESEFETNHTEYAITNQDDTAISQHERTLVERLAHNLHENDTNMTKTRRTLDSEFQNALAYAAVDIDAMAQKVVKADNSSKFNEAMRTASNKLRWQTAQTDSEIAHLMDTIDQSNSNDCVTHIMTWFKQHFEYLADLDRIVDSDGSFTAQSAFSADGPIVQCALERADLRSSRRRLFEEFVKQVEEETATSESLLEYLNNLNGTQNTLKFVRSYIKDRQEERRLQQEELMRELNQQIEQQRQEQQARALEVATTLYQLAVGSPSESHFNTKLKEMLDQPSVSEQFVPIIVGHIEQSTEKELPLMICLEADYDTWALDADSIQQRFCSALSESMKIPTDAIRIERVERGSTILHLLVRPPHGQIVMERIHRSEKNDAMINIEAIRVCCAKFDARIHSIVLGEYGLTAEKRLMDSRWNKIYVSSQEQKGDTYWSGSLDRGGKPYFCPEGWQRFGIKVAENNADFDHKWGSWHIAYHGTRSSNAPLILTSGLRVSIKGCYLKSNCHAVYLSPSIEYSAHPRYARPWKKPDDSSGKQKWCQLVFQCRVNPKAAGQPQWETLLRDKTVHIDKNFRNDELEWIIPTENATQEYIRDNIVCYGLMMRVVEGEPRDLPASQWWKYSYHTDY